MTVLTDTQVVTASGGLVELGYSQITSPVSITSATEASPNTVISSLTVVCDGSPIWVEFSAPYLDLGSGTGNWCIVNVWVDGVDNGRISQTYTAVALGGSIQPGACQGRARLTPSAGSHTISITAIRNTANCTIGAGAGGASTTRPAFLRVSKIVQATQWPAVTTGTIICTSSTRPASPFAGQQIYETDTSKSLIYNGTAWVSPQAQTVPPMVMARRTSSQNLVQNTLTPIQFDGTNVFDTNLMHSDSSASPTTPPASNNTRITIKTAGVYQLNGWGYFASGSATTYRLIGFSKNGTEILSTNPKAGGLDNRVQASLLDSAAVNDYYEMWMYHDQGANIGLLAVQGVYAMFSAHFIGKTA